MMPKRIEKPLHWVGSSKNDLVALPADLVDDFGYALRRFRWAQRQHTPNHGKAEDRGCWNWWRTSRGYVQGRVPVRFAKAVHVLHCFQKKSPSSRRTSQSDIDLIHQQLKLAQQHYEEHHEHQS